MWQQLTDKDRNKEGKRIKWDGDTQGMGEKKQMQFIRRESELGRTGLIQRVIKLSTIVSPCKMSVWDPAEIQLCGKKKKGSSLQLACKLQ